MRRLIPTIMLFAALATLVGAAGSKRPSSTWDAESLKRKAQYIAIETATPYNEERYDDYFALLERAFSLDTSDIYIAGEWGESCLARTNLDSATYERAYRYIKGRFLADPTDYNNAVVLSKAAHAMHKFDDLVMVWQIVDSLSPSRTDPSINLANAYIIKYITGDTTALNKAYAILQRVEDGSGKDVGLTSYKIRALALRNDTAAIFDELNALHSATKNDAMANFYIGQNYETYNRPDSALTFYDRAISLDSTLGGVYLSRANLYLKRGDSTAYDHEIFMALESQNLDFDTKRSLLGEYIGALYTDTTQYPRIEKLFDVLQEVNPGEAELHKMYSSFLYMTGETDRAAGQLEYAIALDPYNEAYYQMLVQLKMQDTPDDKYFALLDAATEHFPENPSYLFSKALGKHMLDQHDEALSILQNIPDTAIHTSRQMALKYEMAAEIMQRRGDCIDSVLAMYQKGVELDMDNDMTLNNYAYLLAENNRDLDKAQQYSALALKGEPDNETFLDTYAWIMFKQEKYPEAKQYIDMTLQLMTDTVPMEEDIEAGDIADAPDATTTDAVLERLEKATSGDTNIPSDVLDHAGDIYFMCGDTDRAVRFWMLAHKIDPDNKTIQRKIKTRTYTPE